jgi:thiol-disulfide isomerase/thioredoxin
MLHRLLLACVAAMTLPGLAVAAAVPGSPAPALVLAARDGGKVDLAALKGQVVMINFWATWCGPCRQEMPLLAQLQTKYEPLGFTLLGVNVEPDSAAAVTWLQGMNVNFPILFDTDSAVAGRFGVEGMPSTVFVDRTGQVRYVHRGYKPGDEAKYADMIRRLVKE